MAEILTWMANHPFLTAWIVLCLARAKPLTLFYSTTEVGKRKTVVEREYEESKE